MDKKSELVEILGVQLAIKKIEDFINIPDNDIKIVEAYLKKRNMADVAISHLKTLFKITQNEDGVSVKIIQECDNDKATGT